MPHEETVLAKTGKTRDEWHAILDTFDARTKGHKAAAAYLRDVHGVGAWWAQSLTVHYERARGIREVGQRHGGRFAVNVSRTIGCSLEEVWDAWADPSKVSLWLTPGTRQDFREGGIYENADGGKGTFKKLVPQGRLHFTSEGEGASAGSLVIVEFLPKASGKVTVAVTHERLGDRDACENAKKAWGIRLDSLKTFLESVKSP